MTTSTHWYIISPKGAIRMNTLEYLTKWLDTFVQPFRAANTVACYKRAINALPASVLQLDLQQLDALTIQGVLNRQAVQHPRAAQLTYAMFHAALTKAEQLRLIDRTPMVACVKPIHEPARAAVLDPAQLTAYLQAAADQPGYALLLLMATCGLRRSEALGLQWRDINLQDATMTICRQRLRLHHGYQTAPLKSRAAHRVLPIPDRVLFVLQQLRADQRERAFCGWVCDTTPEALRKSHRAALRAAGLPISVTLHGLRHSMATIAAAHGTPMRILQGILGHAKYDLTANLYADHLRSDDFRPFMAMLERSLG